ncbi:DUF3040 domain-containing protein [Streptomyces polygonati]|uniref:DUF3040 domain-containing protein n=1 Tax=Streptomyces polygonati TaxID=1617087 RepID=A0ABV8HLX1_9ACTN
MDDVSLSARERRALQDLEKVLRRQNRLYIRRMRPAARWAPPAKRRPRPGVRALISLSASLMALTTLTSGRWTRRATALAFGAVWLLALGIAPRNAGV